MRKFEAFLLVALTGSWVVAIPGISAAAGMGGGAMMGGGGMGGGMTMSGYSYGGSMMRGQGRTYGTDPQDDQPGTGNISISGRHVVKLSPARQGLPKIDRSIVGTIVPVPEMPDK
ncbi:MAG TPA: hypothetical protein VIX12_09230 [Candidatus Binataceae bacterium]